MRYWLKHNIIGITYSIGVIIILLIILPIFSRVSNSIVISSRDIKNNIVPPSVDKDYTPPDSSMPKSIGLVYNLLDSNNKKNSGVTLSLNESNIKATVTKDDEEKNYYIEYSTIYDCSLIKKDINDKEPLNILYHFEYDKLEDYSMEMFSLLKSNSIGSIHTVNILKTEDGTINLNVK